MEASRSSALSAGKLQAASGPRSELGRLLLVQVCEEADLLTKHFAKLTLDAPGYTPWFDTWMKLYLQTLPVVEHEFLRHSLGVIFVVSTNSKQPVEAFRQLSGNAIY